MHSKFLWLPMHQIFSVFWGEAVFARRFFVILNGSRWGKVDQKKLKHFGTVCLLSSPLSPLAIIAASVHSCWYIGIPTISPCQMTTVVFAVVFSLEAFPHLRESNPLWMPLESPKSWKIPYGCAGYFWYLFPQTRVKPATSVKSKQIASYHR